MRRVLLCVLLCSSMLMPAQSERRRLEMPRLPGRPALSAKGITEPDEPAHPEPAATDLRDAKFGVSFHVPAGWNFSRDDGDLSSFRRDVRSVGRGVSVRGVASINYNPYPVTTFAGAYFYYSVVPRTNALACAAQTIDGFQRDADRRIAGVVFRHGSDRHGSICTESRGEVYTAMRGNSCLRFDVVIDTFCAQTSGAMEITRGQLDDFNGRLAGIVDSIRIDGK